MQQATYATGVLLGCLLCATTTAAQTPLPEDFGLSEKTITLPESLRAEAGYPVWRLVTMWGKEAVPYRYCAWLQNKKPWTQSVFAENLWQARKNCADGITKVTRANVDVTVPEPGSDAAFWRQRPVGYQYMVPDHQLSQADYNALMHSSQDTAVLFVANAPALAAFMEKAEARISALEEWQTSIEASGGVLTTESLEDWLTDNDFLQADDLPTGETLNKEQKQALLESLSLDPSTLLTKQEAEDVYQQKGSALAPPSANQNDDWWAWHWYWLLPILLALVLASAALLLWWFMSRVVNNKEHGLAKTNQTANAAISRIDDVRSGLEAQIELDAAGRLEAFGFNNEMLGKLGDRPFELKMPGTGVARKKILVYNRGDHLELFGMEKGHDRVDKIDVIAVYKHLAKALRPENNWVTGVTAQRAG